uniref:Uncharacterized protein n=1 Tax=Anguilla anguilla TaxID=7936 RepID=A0A0E9XJ80_ANGAN
MKHKYVLKNKLENQMNAVNLIG